MLHPFGVIIAFDNSMKKWTPWLLGLFILFLLVLRLLYSHVNNLGKEKEWYIAALQYECSARIDSIIRPGRALITIVSGKLDPDREWQLKGKLRAHGTLHLVIVNQEWFDLRVPMEALENDSLSINSDRDLLSIYRDGKLLSHHSLSESLRQRPF